MQEAVLRGWLFFPVTTTQNLSFFPPHLLSFFLSFFFFFSSIFSPCFFSFPPPPHLWIYHGREKGDDEFYGIFEWKSGSVTFARIKGLSERISPVDWGYDRRPLGRRSLFLERMEFCLFETIDINLYLHEIAITLKNIYSIFVSRQTNSGTRTSKWTEMKLNWNLCSTIKIRWDKFVTFTNKIRRKLFYARIPHLAHIRRGNTELFIHFPMIHLDLSHLHVTKRINGEGW